MKASKLARGLGGYALGRSHLLFPRDVDDPQVAEQMTGLGFTFYPALGVWVALEEGDTLEDVAAYLDEAGYPAEPPQ